MTPFLKLCKKMNITYKDGADMLLGQGVLANNYFTQGAFDLKKVQEVMKESFSF
jgi:shikimate dehydrogenase